MSDSEEFFKLNLTDLQSFSPFRFQKSPVWEITGAEFSRAGSHTAGANATQKGISIRFPRVTRLRHDKTWREATDVPQLKALLTTSHTISDWSRRLKAISLHSSPSTTRDTLKRAFEEEEEEIEMKVVYLALYLFNFYS